jgi:hypothetical protein
MLLPMHGSNHVDRRLFEGWMRVKITTHSYVWSMEELTCGEKVAYNINDHLPIAQ